MHWRFAIYHDLVLTQSPGTLISVRDCQDVLTAHHLTTTADDPALLAAINALLKELTARGAIRPAEFPGIRAHQTIGPIPRAATAAPAPPAAPTGSAGPTAYTTRSAPTRFCSVCKIRLDPELYARPTDTAHVDCRPEPISPGILGRRRR